MNRFKNLDKKASSSGSETSTDEVFFGLYKGIIEFSSDIKRLFSMLIDFDLSYLMLENLC
jgi:hypothetical protein